MAEDVSPENPSNAEPQLVKPVSSDIGSATQSADMTMMAVNHESRMQPDQANRE